MTCCFYFEFLILESSNSVVKYKQVCVVLNKTGHVAELSSESEYLNESVVVVMRSLMLKLVLWTYLEFLQIPLLLIITTLYF